MYVGIVIVYLRGKGIRAECKKSFSGQQQLAIKETTEGSSIRVLQVVVMLDNASSKDLIYTSSI